MRFARARSLFGRQPKMRCGGKADYMRHLSTGHFVKCPVTLTTCTTIKDEFVSGKLIGCLMGHSIS